MPNSGISFPIRTLKQPKMFISLLLTDFSDTAATAADFYLSNLPGSESRCMLYHNIDYPVGQVDSSISLEVLTERAIEDLKNEKDRLARIFPQVQIDSTYTVGRISSALEDVIKDFSVDLLVMGAPSGKGFVELISGSDFYSDVLKAECPVMICPSGTQADVIKEITLACFAGQKLEEKRFAALVKLLKNKSAAIDLLLMQEEDEEKNSAAELFFKRVFLENNLSITRVEKENEADEIKYFSEKLHADLVALLPEERDFFKSLFSGNMEEKLRKQLNQPLLIL